MSVQILLVDINPRMVKAWRKTFENNSEVTIVEGSMLQQEVDAWVTPTNSRASMDGGLDAVIRNYLGASIEARVQAEVHRQFHGTLPVGHAVCVRTGHEVPKFLISTPTMHNSSEDISDTLNVALACAAALQAVRVQNRIEPGSIETVALPGLGASTGKTPVEICADLMWTSYDSFRAYEFNDFIEMRRALQEQLGDLTPIPEELLPSAKQAKPAAKATSQPKASTPSVHKVADVDFDDAE